MPLTSRWSLPYPLLSDAANVPLDLQALADSLDNVAMDYPQDVIANRPVAAAAGRYFWATDLGALSRDDGSAWQTVGTPMQTGVFTARPAAASSNAGFVYYATDIDAMYRSTGAAWVRLSQAVGQMAAFPMAALPTGWVAMGGQAISRTNPYADLFAYLGTYYGVGNGTTTFNLPDYRGMLPVGLDNQGGSDAGRLSLANTVGLDVGGEQNSTLTAANLPPHIHDNGTLVTDTEPAHFHNIPMQTVDGSVAVSRPDVSSSFASNAAMSTDPAGAHDHDVTGQTANNSSPATMSSTPFSNMQPGRLAVWAIRA